MYKRQVDGGLTDISYMPDYGVGYSFSINSESGDAFEKVGKAVRAYITHSLQKPVVPPVAQLPVNAADYAGWYEPDSPRTELSHFIGRLVRLSRVRFEDGKMISSALGSWHQVHIPVEGAQFRFEDKEAPPEPVATLAVSYTHLDVYKRQVCNRGGLCCLQIYELSRLGGDVRLAFGKIRQAYQVITMGSDVLGAKHLTPSTMQQFPKRLSWEVYVDSF